MNEKIIILAVSGILLSGCITKSIVYQNVERTRIEFENDAAARLFYETLSKNSANQKLSESTTTIHIPIIYKTERKVVPGPSAEFNEAVAICDSNKDGRITEAEARIYANVKP
jgi:Na+-translocating ferredoxin:NAD+ oxidoreductase RnfG subunit